VAGPDLPIVIGTAGHVDHGKTTLIKTLTGVDTDRLEEEKRRGLTIDLGFAPFTLPSGRIASVVDVPGHEKFLKNMLAGVGGMDLVLLVVAADDGVMPQTREHLDILHLLHVGAGIVVVTKRDLVDPDLLDLALADIAETLAGTFLEAAPCVAVSAQTGEGIADLLQEIDKLAARVVTRDATAPARLPVDRVFVKQGFGTVVTGTMFAGTLREGDTVDIQPAGVKARVRGLQVHGGKRDAVQAGQRVAINLAVTGHADLERGEWLVMPGMLSPATVLDVQIEMLPDAPPLEHRDRVRVHHGTAEVIARVALLDRDELAPGEDAPAQLLLESPLVADFADRFVLRRYSPAHTIAGGRVLHPRSRKARRRSPVHLERLAAYREGLFGKGLDAALRESGLEPKVKADLLRQVPHHAAEAAWAELEAAGSLYRLEGGFVHQAVVGEVERRITDAAGAFCAAQPHRAGMAREALQAELQVVPARLAHILGDMAARGAIRLAGRLAIPAGFAPAFSGDAARAQAVLIERLSAGHLCDEDDLLRDLPEQGRQILDDWVETGQVVKLGGGIFATPAGLEGVKAKLQEVFAQQPQLTAAQLRDALETSRKFIIPLLEHLDSAGFTRRQGDVRTLAPRSP
jgi:selenocysteine-specific elongation factor